MAKTYAQQLEEVQAAIGGIESRGQAATAEGRMLTRADLRTLYDREAFLRKMADRESAGGIRVRNVVPE